MKRSLSSVILFFFALFQLLPFLPVSVQNSPIGKALNNAHLSFFKPQSLDAAGLSSASATLSNPRLSFEAGVNGTFTAGNTIITIAGSGNADNSTAHLFPNDVVTIGANSGLTVKAIADATNFVVDTGLGSGVTSANKVYSAQTGTLTVSFYTASAIPVGGSILVEVPSATGAVSGNQNDGLPDTAAAGSNGFDFNGITTANVTCPSGFAVAAATAGSAGTTHKVSCNWSNGTSALPAGANLSVTVGNAAKGLVNPAPVTGHTVGQADGYSIILSTTGSVAGTGTVIETIPVKVAPVEGVLVSATIDETLNFTIAGVTSANIATTCSMTAPAGNLVTSTATAVPFGNSINANTFYNAAQLLTVSTNAPGGYAVKVEENDQMGKDGKVCTGGSAGESVNCIRDTACGGSACTESTSADWSTATGFSGLGYSLANVSGTNAAFTYNESSRTYSARQFADVEAGETKATIMSAATGVSGSSACVLYRLTVSGTQPAGYYFNKVKYTASATF